MKFISSTAFFNIWISRFSAKITMLAQYLKKNGNFKFWGNTVEDMYFKSRILKIIHLYYGICNWLVIWLLQFTLKFISSKYLGNQITNFSMFNTPLIDISPSPRRLVIQRASSLKYLLTWKTSFCYIVYIIYLLLYFKMMSITRGPLQRYDISLRFI